MSLGIKEFHKCLTMNEQVKLIEDSMKPGFKQSAAAIKLEVSKACVNGILKRKEKILENFQKDAKNKNSKKYIYFAA